MDIVDKVALTVIVTWVVGGLLLSGYFYHGPCQGMGPEPEKHSVHCTVWASIMWPVVLPAHISHRVFAP